MIPKLDLSKLKRDVDCENFTENLVEDDYDENSDDSDDLSQ